MTRTMSGLCLLEPPKRVGGGNLGGKSYLFLRYECSDSSQGYCPTVGAPSSAIDHASVQVQKVWFVYQAKWRNPSPSEVIKYSPQSTICRITHMEQWSNGAYVLFIHSRPCPLLLCLIPTSEIIP
jgi:hypothetical protein